MFSKIAITFAVVLLAPSTPGQLPVWVLIINMTDWAWGWASINLTEIGPKAGILRGYPLAKGWRKYPYCRLYKVRNNPARTGLIRCGLDIYGIFRLLIKPNLQNIASINYL